MNMKYEKFRIIGWENQLHWLKENTCIVCKLLEMVGSLLLLAVKEMSLVTYQTVIRLNSNGCIINLCITINSVPKDSLYISYNTWILLILWPLRHFCVCNCFKKKWPETDLIEPECSTDDNEAWKFENHLVREPTLLIKEEHLKQILSYSNSNTTYTYCPFVVLVISIRTIILKKPNTHQYQHIGALTLNWWQRGMKNFTIIWYEDIYF